MSRRALRSVLPWRHRSGLVSGCATAETAAKMRGMFRAEEFLDLKQFPFPELFDGCEYVWDALERLPEFVKARVKATRYEAAVGTPFIAEDVYIGKGTGV